MPSKENNRFLKKKNLLDLGYQTILNYFNIISIGGITAIVSLFVAWITNQIEFNAFLALAFLVILTVILIIYLINEKLNEIKNKIKALKLK